jgi:hypothetical protein
MNKRKLSIFALTIITVFTVCTPLRANTQACNAGTIQGGYGFKVDGLAAASGNGTTPLTTNVFVPFANAGRFLFTSNGSGSLDGTLTGSQAGNFGGIQNSGDFTGTYSVNSDCTGIITRTIGETVQTFQIVVVQGGATIDFAILSSSDTPRVGSGLMARQ